MDGSHDERVSRTVGALADVWGRPDFRERLASCLADVVPDTHVLLVDWEGDDRSQMRAGGDRAFLADALETPWVRTNAIYRHRPYDPERPGELANRVLTHHQMAHLRPAGWSAFKQLFLEPLGIDGFVRATLYDRYGFVGHLQWFRPSGRPPITEHEHNRVRELVPHLIGGLAARHRFDRARITSSTVASIMDGVLEPALLVSEDGHVVHANQLAREALTSPLLERIRELQSAAWIRWVPFRLEEQPFFLGFLDVLELDAALAPHAPWARRLALPPRFAQVCAYIVRGYADKEIADALDVSVNTVRTYVRRIFDHIGVHSRTELLRALRKAAVGEASGD